MTSATTAAGKILIILSDADSFAIQKKDGTIQQEESGVFLQELTQPLLKLLDNGYSVTFASPQGKGPNIDPLSTSTFAAYLGNWFAKNRDEQLVARMRAENNFDSPRPFHSITNAELASFAGVFIPGGHAPLTDLGADPELGRILWHFHNGVKPTAVICHGPFALLSTQCAPGDPGFAYKGYRITSWSDAEESLVETLKGGTVPAKVESTLAAAGAEMVSNLNKKMGQITVDRELVSGANPMAAASLGDKFIEMLQARRDGASPYARETI
ncbi:class I glutamine amidotransferase-like protein [Phanerochaete sordida]|uniref:D-lactate dehydratase n=1 Tax=Phanerochaete sordida TaxID=48140 RepID=A0A9P3GRH5_9APHY|nr:class I glutamine amidotransferase-like protein [Phanerochaete sordida]